MADKPKLLSGAKLREMIDNLARKHRSEEEQTLKDMGAWPVVNDTLARIKSDMATKPSDEKIREMARGLTRSNITKVIVALGEYQPCDFDSIEREDDIDEWCMCRQVAQAYIKRLESIL